MMTRFLEAIVRLLLPIINRVYVAVLGIKPLHHDSIICVEVRRHKGSPVRLKDGCEVNPGDEVIKLHLNNAWIARKWRRNSAPGTRDFRRGLIYYFKESLELLARELADGKYRGAVAIYGWTAFHTQAGRLGFQVMDLPDSLRTKLARLHITALLRDHQTSWSKKRGSSRKPVTVKAIWVSRAQLLRMYSLAL